MFALIFSPFGCVGRAPWWLSKLVFLLIVMAMAVDVSAGMAASKGDQHLANILQVMAKGGHLSPDSSRYLGQKVGGEVIVFIGLAAVGLVAMWANLVIEIKRWHDRGYSGFCIFLNVIPAILHIFTPAAFAAVVGFVVDIFVLVQLGFLGQADIPYGDYEAPAPSRSSRASEPSEKKTNVLVPVLVILLVGVVGAWIWTSVHKSGTAATADVPPPPAFPQTNAVAVVAPGATPSESMFATPSPAAAPVAIVAPTQAPVTIVAPTQAPASTPVAVVAPTPDVSSPPQGDAIYHGTSSTQFGKNWVVVNGTKIDGVKTVNPAPHGQIAIMYGDGGKNFPASAVPQGFLDAWNMTPDRLKAEDGQ